MLIFYDNFYFEDCFIDMQNHKIEIKEKFQYPEVIKIKYRSLDYDQENQ